jgi:hypothetical protein
MRIHFVISGAMLGALCSALPRAARAQDTVRTPHAAQPERPTVATHAGTVAPGWLEFESGLELDRGPSTARNTIFTTVAKLGLARRLQLTVMTNVSGPSGAAGGFGDLSAGIKWRVLQGDAILGDFALLPAIKVPTGSVARGTGTGTTDASLTLISSRDVGPVHIDLNAGYFLRGGSGASAPPDQWLWTASFGGDLGGGAGWTAELYGYPGTGGANGVAPIAALLAGPTFTVREWLVLDAGLIVPVTGPQPRAAYVGATFNVGRVW